MILLTCKMHIFIYTRSCDGGISYGYSVYHHNTHVYLSLYHAYLHCRIVDSRSTFSSSFKMMSDAATTMLVTSTMTLMPFYLENILCQRFPSIVEPLTQTCARPRRAHSLTRFFRITDHPFASQIQTNWTLPPRYQTASLQMKH
jgi:hypothetical protein